MRWALVRSDSNLHQTYELFLADPVTGARFHALTCRPQDLILETQRVIEREGAASADVSQFGRPLFTIMAAEKSPG